MIRFEKNLGSFTTAELELIRTKSVCVVGCGGLGCFAVNALARFGVARLTLIDGDMFSESNLNRQLFARPDTLGMNKAAVCAREAELINPELCADSVCEMLCAGNAERLLSGHDLVIDCLDSAKARIMLEEQCFNLGLTFIHGALEGFYGQTAIVAPGDFLMKKLYDEAPTPTKSAPVFTVQLVAALQCSEALKLLAGRKAQMHGRLLHVNLEDNLFSLLEP